MHIHIHIYTASTYMWLKTSPALTACLIYAMYMCWSATGRCGACCCVYVYVNMCTDICICRHVYIQTCICACVCNSYPYRFVYVHIYTHVRTCIYIHRCARSVAARATSRTRQWQPATTLSGCIATSWACIYTYIFTYTYMCMCRELDV